ncbi:MAG: endonuclease/exonuclease/phosphatase family protein [Candidatus Nanopelagicales bacterium]
MTSRMHGLLVLGCAAALSLAACTSEPDSDAAPEAINSAESPVSVRVMQFNIEYGGDRVDFDSVSAAIEAADADVVAIQEGYGKMPDIAADLGWDYYDARTQVVSRFPLLNPPDPESGAIFVELAPGKVFALMNIHLPSTGYGPNKAVTGATAEELVAGEKGRVKALEPTVANATELMDQEIPAIITGDFNAPSHRDWTAESVGIREQLTQVMAWPTSEMAEGAGMVDVYRTIYPDPVAHQGLTWPASRPFVQGYNPGPAGKPADRIDLMYAGGEIEPTAASIVGEKSSEFTDIAVSQWPSDHRAMVATLDVLPGTAPTLVSVDQRLVEIGDETNVYYNAEHDDAAEIGIKPAGGPQKQGVGVGQLVDDSSAGQWQLPTNDLVPGQYDVSLLADDGGILATTSVWLVEPGTPPKVMTVKKSYASGEPIDVKWDLAPGSKWDWVALYKRGANPNVAWYKAWLYTDATVEGEATFDGTPAHQWPLPAGQYSVYLLLDDSYVKIADGNFTVT